MGKLGGSHVAVYDSYGKLPADVTAFLANYSSDELCLSGSWFELLARYSPEKGHGVRIYAVRSSEPATVDCLLFAMSATPARRPRKLLSLTNFYTMSYAPLLRPGLIDVQATLNALASFIARERPRWDMVELRGCIAEQPVTTQLSQAFRQAGLLTDSFAQFDNWFYPTNGIGPADYFKARPSQVRNTITRKLKKVQKEHKIDFELHRTPEDLPPGAEAWQKIYAQSWKEPELYPDFIPQLLRRSAELGQLRLGVLRVDGEAAAAQIWLLTGGRATIYKLAYDEKFSSLSVGSLLTKMMFDYVLENDTITEVDYGIGSESYKLDWMSDCRHIVGLVGFNRFSLMGLTAALRHRMGRLARAKLQKERDASASGDTPPANVITEGVAR